MPSANSRTKAAHPRVNSRPAARKCCCASGGSLVTGRSATLPPVRTRLRMKRRVACWSSSRSACIARLCPSCLSFVCIMRLPPCLFLLLLLHHDGQIHTGVDGAVEMEGPGCGEGAKSGLTRATDLQILDLRCVGLVL